MYLQRVLDGHTRSRRGTSGEKGASQSDAPVGYNARPLLETK